MYPSLGLQGESLNIYEVQQTRVVHAQKTPLRKAAFLKVRLPLITRCSLQPRRNLSQPDADRGACYKDYNRRL